MQKPRAASDGVGGKTGFPLLRLANFCHPPGADSCSPTSSLLISLFRRTADISKNHNFNVKVIEPKPGPIQVFPGISGYFRVIPTPKIISESTGDGLQESRTFTIQNSKFTTPPAKSPHFYDPVPQQWPFLRIFGLFAANPLKCLSMNHLHAKLCSSGQAQSNPVKANQDTFLSLTINSHPNQGCRPFQVNHANGGWNVARNSHFRNWP